MKNIKYTCIDEADKASVMPVKSPFEYAYSRITLYDQPVGIFKAAGKTRLSLCGNWQMAESGYECERKDPDTVWQDAQDYEVPGSIHTSLLKNGKIPDPLIGLNDKKARENSYKVWWCRREFDYDGSLKRPRLVFEGVCYSAMFYLNGHCIGNHCGMFTQAVFDVGKLLKRHNVLVVRIDDAPALPRAYSKDADFDDGWKFGTVINCVYGWHYACIPSRGIWKPVYIEETPAVFCEKPFFSTVNAQTGEIDLSIKTLPGVTGMLSLCIYPKNFAGETSFFSGEFHAGEEGRIHYRFFVPDFRLWWPNQCGEQNLYEAKVVFAPDNAEAAQFCETFGIRTVEMVHGSIAPNENAYRWQLRVNGRDVFLKGANWCTTDVLLRFNKKTYRRFLTLAKAQNLNLLRSWGCGMPESETFYDLCDELGLLVFQEWPTAWDSDKMQPFPEMHETVEQNMIRIRNHPSLALYAGGNESGKAHSPIIDDMIRLSYELDGTRPFRRTFPYGEGSLHSYATYWMQYGIDATLQLEAVLLSEFGMASAPNVDSVLRYTPEEEYDLWDLRGEHNTFVHHTPRFNQHLTWPDYSQTDVDHLTKYLGNFYDEENLEHFVTGTQLAQAVIYKHPIEKFRSNYPNSTGISYYKLNDVYPACSWATVDYYGAPKLSYYVVKHAFEPLHACVVTPSIDVKENAVLPVCLLNDNLERADRVRCRILDKHFRTLYETHFDVKTIRMQVCKIGELRFPASDGPLFVVLQIIADGEVKSTNFDFFNYQNDSGCLFRLKQTQLSLRAVDQETISIRNTGDVPAVCVMVDCFGNNDVFFADDNALWLDAGEETLLKVNCTQGLRVRAFNANWE